MHGIVFYVGLTCGVIVLITLAVLIYLFFFRGRGVSLPIDVGNTTWLALGWGFLIFIPFLIAYEWWSERVFSPIGIALIIGFTLYGYMSKGDPNKPFRYSLAIIAMWLLGAVATWHVFGVYFEDKVKAWISSSSDSAISTTTPATATSVNVEWEVKRFWFEKLEPDDAWVMIGVADLESRFTQWGANGKVFRGQNPKDVCVMQINEDVWLSEARKLGHDLSTLDGCLNMALHINKENGPQEWTSYEKVKKSLEGQETFSIDVPVETWSERAIVEGRHCLGVPSAELKVRDDQGNEYFLGPKMIPTAPTKWWEYSASGTPAKVNFRCRT